MFYFLLFILIITILLFIPIPIKIKVNFKKGNYSILLYNIVLLSNDKGILNKYIHKDANKTKESLNNNSKSENNLNRKLDYKKLYSNLNTNKFKPKLKFIGHLDYSLNDASNTAILYGLLCNINPILYKLFSTIFSIKHIKLKIVPRFKNLILLEFSINSIITINFAQIIYILFLILKSLRINKEVCPD